MSKLIHQDEMLVLFTAFSNAVKAKKYKPLEYQLWKKIKEYITQTEKVYITYNKNQIIIDFQSVNFILLTVEGNSFGAYLFDKLFNTNSKEDNKVKFNFDFGPVSGNTVRMSMYGLAVKNKSGTWVSYDAKSGDVMDVDVFNFDGAKFLYKMPVAIKDISVGDVIVHHNAPMFVVAIPSDNKAVIAVDPIAGERKEIMLTKSPFGFNFVTKVINFLGDTLSGSASAENPFGNLGLMMMLSEDGNGVKDMLPLMLMANGGNIDMSNPLMMYALMSSDGKMGDMLPFLFMMNANKPAAPAHECKCGGHCGEN